MLNDARIKIVCMQPWTIEWVHSPPSNVYDATDITVTGQINCYYHGIIIIICTPLVLYFLSLAMDLRWLCFCILFSWFYHACHGVSFFTVFGRGRDYYSNIMWSFFCWVGRVRCCDKPPLLYNWLDHNSLLLSDDLSDMCHCSAVHPSAVLLHYSSSSWQQRMQMLCIQHAALQVVCFHVASEWYVILWSLQGRMLIIGVHK